MAGYKDYSMSNNAASAYGDNRMPLSKWTKTEMLDSIENYLHRIGNKDHYRKFENLTKKELTQFLSTDGEWHHTSKFYNKTPFYAINEGEIDRFCEAGETANYIICLLDKNEYTSKEANAEGLFFTKDKAQAKLFTEYEANRRVKINAEFNKRTEKELVK